MKKLVVDLDGTLTIDSDAPYSDKPVNEKVLEKLRTYKDKGFEIIISTSRNMRTYSNSIGKINIHTLPGIIEWLDKHNVPYDEIHVAKPWCGFDGFYIDDKSIRPSEFASLDHEEIVELLAKENPFKDGGNA
ncbi:HAD-IIIC family phosphatase [Paraglaciecola sp.]|uniref:HAD-IIIC family phosphatase n=1 Tax=Paraglaciecola sp. TaxID=1920173 RepID=UPI003266B826